MRRNMRARFQRSQHKGTVLLEFQPACRNVLLGIADIISPFPIITCS